MESREKPDSYGEWAIRRVQQEAGEGGNVLPAEVITTARVVWPRAVAVVASELNREGSGREAETLAAEIWEGVLRSVAKALPVRPSGTSNLIFWPRSTIDSTDFGKQNVDGAIGFSSLRRALI